MSSFEAPEEADRIMNDFTMKNYELAPATKLIE